VSRAQSELSIEVEAPGELVFAIARDVERWPRLLPHYVSVVALRHEPRGATVARFVARRPLVPVLGLELPVAWRSRAWAEPDHLRLRFEHLGGATAGMSVTWRIEPTKTGCRVVIEHRFDAPFAGLVERFFVRPIAGRTLAAFKAIAEALATTQTGGGQR